MTIVYIAGPMTGLPEHNFPAFHAAEQQLRADGRYEILNPARRGVRDDWTYADYLRAAIRDVLLADAVAVLPGWMTSRGARLETDIAHALNLPVVSVDFLLHARVDIVRHIIPTGAAE